MLSRVYTVEKGTFRRHGWGFGRAKGHCPYKPELAVLITVAASPTSTKDNKLDYDIVPAYVGI